MACNLFTRGSHRVSGPFVRLDKPSPSSARHCTPNNSVTSWLIRHSLAYLRFVLQLFQQHQREVIG